MQRVGLAEKISFFWGFYFHILYYWFGQIRISKAAWFQTGVKIIIYSTTHKTEAYIFQFFHYF